MNNKIYILCFLIALISCKKDNKIDSTINSEKNQAKKDFLENYITSSTLQSEINWTGNTTNCNPGTIANSVYDKTLLRVNYFRKLCGLPNRIIWNNANHIGCQQMALMILANSKLSHYPPATWSCYTLAGAKSAEKSNLAYGRIGTEGISQFIEDAGSNNASVGHRNWILYSQATKMAFGCTNNTAVLDVLSDFNYNLTIPNLPAFIHYPAKYTPFELMYKRWSFNIPRIGNTNINYDNATVKVTNSSGTEIPITIISRIPSTGDPALVWEPRDYLKIIGDKGEDMVFNVKIGNVLVGTSIKNYEYSITSFSPYL